MSLAILFAGQGTQHAAMLPWLDGDLAAAPMLTVVTDRYGAPWRSRLADEAWAQTNAVAQPLLTALGLAAWQALAPLLPAPSVFAGYSVGELAAFCAAGVFDASQALALADERAAAMDRSVTGVDTGLLAVQGLDARAMQAVCAPLGIAVAIQLAQDRAVLGGLCSALELAETAFSQQGVRCKRLPVQVASHTPWMTAAADAFEARLHTESWSRPHAVLVCNHNGGAERSVQGLRRQLAQQICSTVLWSQCMDTVAERQVRCVLEIGGGQALSTLWRDRYPDIACRSADEFRSAQAIAGWVRTVLR